MFDNFTEGTVKVDEAYSFGQTYEFVDHSGKTLTLWSSYTFWHPSFKEQLGLETFGDFIKWWVENRDALMSGGRVLPDEVLLMFNFGRPYEKLMELTLRTLRSDYDFMLGSAFGGVSSVSPRRSTRDFKLVTFDAPTAQNEFEIHRFEQYGQIVVKKITPTATSAAIPERWRVTHNYTFKMDEGSYEWFRSHKGESNAWFGVELEVSTRLSNEEIQYIVTEVEPKQKPFFIFKSDSSVSGCYERAVEMVTVPCTPRYLRVNFKLFFQKLEKLAAAKGKEIGDFFDTSEDLSNGIHVHVDRDCFANRSAQRRFVATWQTRDRKMLKLYDDVTKRPGGVMGSSYSRPSAEYRGRTVAGKLDWRYPIPTDRTSIINEGNSYTLEVRAYQGIFNLRHIMQCISFTELMLELSHEMGYKDLGLRMISRVSDTIKTTHKFKSLEEFVKCA